MVNFKSSSLKPKKHVYTNGGQIRNILKLERGVCVFNLAAYLDKRAEVGIDKAAG